MKIQKTPQAINNELQSGIQFNQSRDLYETVAKNQDFYLGDQWKGVNAPDLTKPVFNIVKRVLSYFVAMIVSDDVGVHIRPFREDPISKVKADIVADAVEAVLERTKMNTLCRTAIKNCAVDGDTAMFVGFDPDIETNQDAKGDISPEIVDNTNIYFGNPYSGDVQSQPYILVAQRLFTNQVKDMAQAYGVENWEDITSDITFQPISNEGASDNLTTVITKFWKEPVEVEKGTDPLTGEKIVSRRFTVKMMKVTQNIVLKDETDLGYSDYPIAYMTWEKVKNSYHGRSPITGLIPNQIFINKIYAMCMVYMTNMGFPKIFYDRTKLSTLTNDVTKAISLPNMDMAGKMLDAVKAPDFSNQIMQLVDSTIGYTKDFMGASDAALGNIANPNNTSAIVAVQQASSVPLEIQRLDYYQFYEDIVRSIIDIMACSYGIREVRITPSQAEVLGLIDTEATNALGKTVWQTTTMIDFSELKNLNYDLNVEIGASSYWSETTQVQTMDALFDRGVITNPITYLEGIPDKFIRNKRQIIDEIKQQMEQQQQMMQMQAQAQNPESTWDPNVTAGMQDGTDDRGLESPLDTNGELEQVYAQSKEMYQ